MLAWRPATNMNKGRSSNDRLSTESSVSVKSAFSRRSRNSEELNLKLDALERAWRQCAVVVDPNRRLGATFADNGFEGGIGVRVESLHDESQLGELGIGPGDQIIEASGKVIDKLDTLKLTLGDAKREGAASLSLTFRKVKLPPFQRLATHGLSATKDSFRLARPSPRLTLYRSRVHRILCRSLSTLKGREGLGRGMVRQALCPRPPSLRRSQKN